MSENHAQFGRGARKRRIIKDNAMAAQPFHDRDGWVWMDGSFTPHREAKVHVLTHALHYASCVFEGERAYGGIVFKSREHSRASAQFGPHPGLRHSLQRRGNRQAPSAS